MTKICHMTSAHDTDDVRIFGKECVSLATAGYDTYLVGRGESREDRGVHVVGVGYPSGGRLERMTGFAKKVYEAALALDAEIYHFHDPELLPYGMKLKKAGKKVIFDSHEFYTEQLKHKPYLPDFVTQIIARCYGIYEKYVLRHIDAVIFPCTIGGKNPFAGLCRRTPLISNAAILGEFFDRYDPTAPKIPRSVCYVGGLTEPRGISIDMCAAHKADAQLLLAGEFSPEEYGETLRAMPEYRCVDYRGTLNRDGVLSLLQESQVGLCVLKDFGQYLLVDTFGIKVYEYMSMAMPVILSHSPFNDRMAQQIGFALCVDPDSIDEMADAIRYLLDNPEEARRMGENGRRAVKDEFNWGVEEKKLFALYEDILKN